MSLPPSQQRMRRLGRGRFALGAVTVYLVSFVSQMLLSSTVTARVSVVPFVLVQAILISLWVVLHVRRLRDAGRPTGIVIGVATIYALEIALMTLLMWTLVSAVGPAGGAGSDAGIFHLFVLIYLLAVMSGDPTLGGLQIWMVGFAALLLVPVMVAVGFSLWAATRPSATAPS